MRRLMLPLGLTAMSVICSPLLSEAAQTAAVVPAQPVAAEPGAALTLDAALRLAMEANPDLAVAGREIEAAGGARLQASLRPNPEISITAENLGVAGRETSVEIGQPIEIGGKRAARIAVAERALAVADSELAAKQAEVHANVVQAFYEVLAAQEARRLGQESVELAERAAQAAARQVAAGKIPPVEATKAQVAVSNAKLDLAQAATELANARKRLSANWGNPAPVFSEAVGALDRLPELPALESLSARIEQSPVRMRASREVARREAALRVEQTRRVGNVTLSAGVRHLAQSDEGVGVVGVAIPLPIFDRNQGNIAEALSRLDQARDAERAVTVQLRLALSEAYERYQTARLQVESIRESILPGAQSAFDAATKGFELGKFNFLDVLDAQRTLFAARSQYTRALAEVHRAWADIERALGAQPGIEPN